MKKNNIRYIITVFIMVICVLNTLVVFAQTEQNEEYEKEQQQMLKKWAESYGDCGKRMQYMSEDMKKTYIAEQIKRANENMINMMYYGYIEDAELYHKLDVINFRLENDNTIYYTLKNQKGKEYNQVEYVNIEQQKVQNSAISNAYSWKNWNEEQYETPQNHIYYYAYLKQKQKMYYPPVIHVTGAEKMDKELLPLFLDHIQSVFEEGHSSYYLIEMLNIDISNIKMKDNMATVDFTLQEVLRRYPKNPDTVGYIQKAKQNDNEEYLKLYRKYFTPFYGNYHLRFSGNKENTNSFRIYTGEINDKGKVLYNWAIEQQFPEMDADGTKWYFGTINGTKDDHGRTLITINRKQWNADNRNATEQNYFVTSYGRQITYVLNKSANVTCMNQGNMQLVNTKSFADAASKTSFGASRLFWFKVENNRITEINEMVQQ